jgi:hypothetical protein
MDAQEPEPLRPQVSGVVEAEARARRRERLAGAGAGPAGAVVRPSGEPQGVGPSADASEEVALGIAVKVGGCHVGDRSFIHVSLGDLVVGDQGAQPCRGERIVLVVVGGHSAVLPVPKVVPALEVRGGGDGEFRAARSRGCWRVGAVEGVGDAADQDE